MRLLFVFAAVAISSVSAFGRGQGGWNQGGWNQGGFTQRGRNQGGFNRGPSPPAVNNTGMPCNLTTSYQGFQGNRNQGQNQNGGGTCGNTYECSYDSLLGIGLFCLPAASANRNQCGQLTTDFVPFVCGQGQVCVDATTTAYGTCETVDTTGAPCTDDGTPGLWCSNGQTCAVNPLTGSTPPPATCNDVARMNGICSPIIICSDGQTCNTALITPPNLGFGLCQ